MIFNEIKCHVNTSFGLLGGCIPCIAPWVRACLEPLLKIIALSEQLCLTAWRVIRLLWSNDIGCTDYHSDKKWRNLTTAFPLSEVLSQELFNALYMPWIMIIETILHCFFRQIFLQFHILNRLLYILFQIKCNFTKHIRAWRKQFEQNWNQLNLFFANAPQTATEKCFWWSITNELKFKVYKQPLDELRSVVVACTT